MTCLEEGRPDCVPVADEAASGGLATIVVCTNCRHEPDDSIPQHGAALLADASTASAGQFAVGGIACLGNCKRRLSAAILRDGSWSYVFGDLVETSGADLVAGARLLAGSPDALMPWRGRPESLKRGLVARIPPRHLIEETA